ncbi:unnamed protein product [Scytosiphon promiscuus]
MALGGAGDAGQEGEVGGAAAGCELSLPELEEFQVLLRKALKLERVQWDRRLANHLMSLCQEGHVQMGARRKARVDITRRTAQKVRGCAKGVRAPPIRYSGCRTRAVYWCNVCTNFGGKARAAPLCRPCQPLASAHAEAAKAVAKKTTPFKPIVWRKDQGS